MERIIIMAEEFLRRHKFIRRWRKVLAVMMAMVVFMSTYSMMLPAITLEPGDGPEIGLFADTSAEESAPDGSTVTDSIPEAGARGENLTAETASLPETEPAEPASSEAGLLLDVPAENNPTEDNPVDAAPQEAAPAEPAASEPVPAESPPAEAAPEESPPAEIPSAESPPAGDTPETAPAQAASTAASEPVPRAEEITPAPEEPKYLENEKLIFEDGSMKLTLTVPAAARVAKDATLSVREIGQPFANDGLDENGRKNEYLSYLAAAENTLSLTAEEITYIGKNIVNTPAAELPWARFFVISIKNVDGAITPACVLPVEIIYKNTAETAADGLKVVCLLPNGTMTKVGSETKVAAAAHLSAADSNFDITSKFTDVGMLTFGTFAAEVSEIDAAIEKEKEEAAKADASTAETVDESLSTEPKDESIAESVPAEPEDESVLTEPEDESVATEPEDESLPAEDESVSESIAEEAEKTDEEKAEEETKTEDKPEAADKEIRTLVTKGPDYTVTMTYTADAEIPAGAKLSAKEILPTAYNYKGYMNDAVDALGFSETEAACARARFFDIKIMLGTSEITPAAPVRVDIEYTAPQKLASAENVKAVHFGKEGPQEVAISDVTTDKETAEVSGVAFEAGSFSVYGFVYTVDFTYDGYTFSISDIHEISLGELLAALGIEADTANVENVSIELTEQHDADVQTGEFYAVQDQAGGWVLKSDVGFGNVYTLTVAMESGIKYAITVTDASDLTPLLGAVDIVIGGETITGNDWSVKKDQVYTLYLAFAETPDTSNQFGTQQMTYTLPSSFNVSTTSGSFSIIYNDQPYEGNTFTIDPDTKVVTVDFEDDIWPLIQESGNASFTIEVEGSFSDSNEQVDFGNGIVKNVEVDDQHDVTITKTGTYDETANVVNYTLTVTSVGVNNNIVVTDTITGTALDFCGVDGVVVSGTTSYETTAVGTNGFQTTISQMNDGDTVTINYSADVDFGELTGKGTVTETSNGATIEAEGVPNKEVENDLENEIDYNPLGKSAGAATGEGNTKTLPWTITVNAQQLKDITGIVVTDTISPGSQDIMKYSGAGITVTVLDGETQVDTYSVSWSELGIDTATATTWSYTIPDTYADHTYEYIITYTSDVDVTGRITNTTVSNGVSDDDGHKGSGQGTVGPGEDSVTIEKEATKVTAEDITWTVSFDVPATGLTSAVVTDEYPNYWVSNAVHYIDTIEGEVEVSGLEDGEAYDPDYSDESKAVITFYYLDENNNRVEGLKGTGTQRTVTVVLKTKNDESWLERIGDTHVNNVKLDVNGQVVTTTASAVPPSKGIAKSGKFVEKVTIDGIDYPVYKYTISLHGVEAADFADGPIRIIDDYDDAYLALYEDKGDWFDWTFHWANNSGHTNTWLKTASGNLLDEDGKLTFIVTENNLAKDDNGEFVSSYYLTYYMIVKDEAAIAALNAGSLASDTYSVMLNNEVYWGDFSDQYDVEYQYPAVDKTLLSTDVSKRLANYKIVLNPAKVMMNGGEAMTMEDTAENISIDYQTIAITVEPADGVSASVDDVTYYYSGYTGYYTIPDQCKVTITYSARIIGDGQVTFTNEAIMKGFSDKTTQTETVSSVAEGQLEINWIRLFKHVRGEMNKPLNGAEYTLCDAEGNIILYPAIASEDLAGKPVTFTTGTAFTAPGTSGTHDGYVQIYLSQDTAGMSFQKGHTYYLKETKAPEGYQLSTRIYRFTIADHPDYNDYEYYNDDVMRLADSPEKGVLEVRKTFDGAENLTDTQKQQITFTIVGVNAENEEIFNEMISYADFTDGKYRLANLDPGTYTVTETGWELGGYDYLETTYTIDGETGTAERTGTVIITEDTLSTEHVAEFTNKYESADVSVNVKKMDENGDIYLYGAEFQLFMRNPATGEYEISDSEALTDGKFTIDYENRESGVTITYLPDGDFKLVETQAPSGYYADPDYVEFVIRGGLVEYDGDVLPDNLISIDNWSLTISNKQDHTYTLTKQDALTISKKLEGAEFKIYSYPDNTQIGGVLVTNSDGQIVIDARDYNFTEGAVYYVVETKAPVGYELPEEPTKYYFYNGGTPSGLAGFSARGESIVNIGNGPKSSVVPNTQETTSIKVTKKWVDQTGSQVSTPEGVSSIKFKLYQVATDEDGNVTETQYPDADTVYEIAVEAGDYWRPLEITDLPTGKSDSGQIITYTYKAVEEPAGDYLITYDNNNTASGTITIKNTVTKLSVIKRWKDVNGYNIPTPDDISSIQFVLYQVASYTDGTTTRTQYPDADTVYTIETAAGVYDSLYTFTNLPTGKIVDGEIAATYSYEVKELAMENYLAVYTYDTANNQVEIANKPKYESTNLEVQKVWLDGNGDELENPPEEITVKLQCAEAALSGPTVTVITISRWGVSYTGSQMVAQGSNVVVSINHGGTLSTEAETIPGNTLTLTNVTSDITVTVTSTDWVGGPIFTSYTPAEAGEFGEKMDVGRPVTLTESENWHYVWRNLPTGAADGSAAYAYFVEEVTVDGKTPAEADCTVTYENNGGIQKGIIYINNTVEERKGTLEVQKTVAGDYTASDTDTFPITIMNGEKYLNAAGELVDSDPGLTVKAGAANKLTFADIPEGTYVVTEGSVELTGYQIVTTYSVTTEGAEAVKTQNAAVTKDQTTLAEITNTYVKDFEFTKVWKRADGAGNDEWVKNITVTLHRKAGTVLDTAFEREFTFGTETDGTTDDGITWVRTGNAADGYTFTFSNLTAADSEGVVYIYTVTENELADYNTSYAGSDQQILVNAEEATAGGCIVNTPVIAVALPETGGPGTHLYTVLGLMLIAFAGIWYAVRMRNSFKRQ